MSSSSSPSDALLTSLKAIFDEYEQSNFGAVATKCQELLKRKKTLRDYQLTEPLQRLWLQALVHQEKWDDIVKAAAEGMENVDDLVLYARYRQQDYTSVVQELDKQMSNEKIWQPHLKAQSHFHLQHHSAMVQSYDKDDAEDVEILTNMIAAMVTLQCIPMVRPENDKEGWIEQAIAKLKSVENEDMTDLAFNVGLYQTLTGQPDGVHWLQVANDQEDDTTATALAWSKHFWYKNDDDISYPSAENSGTLSVPQSIAKFNQALLENSKLPSQPHPKWNRLQLQLYWYNRAIRQFQSQQYVECQESCQSLLRNVNNDKTTKKKKSKGSSATSISASELWWQARVDVLLANVLNSQSKSKEALQNLSQRLEILQKAEQCFAVDHAIAHVMLHQHVLKNKSASLLPVLQALPKSIQACPAVQWTMDDLQVQNGNTATSKGTAPKSPREQADALFGQGEYQQACDLYQEALSNGKDDDSEAVRDSQLRYVQALAMTGRMEASQTLWESLQEDDDNLNVELPDATALEQKALPRSTNVRSNGLLAAINDADNINDKPSRDKILRHRARKREEYLKQLESKGQYNPDRPVPPNPERWIPKHERRRHRGRNNGGNNKSAQGGGSQWDAQRLDAAARRAGKVPMSTGPSSASIKVSTDGQPRKGGGRRR
jgi:tetratricopeptide (TPR) repeat protein